MEAGDRNLPTRQNAYQAKAHVLTGQNDVADPISDPISLDPSDQNSLSVRNERNLVRTAKSTPFPEDFVLNYERAYFGYTTCLVDPIAELERFKDNALADGKMHVSWDAAWRNWCRRARDYRRAHLDDLPEPISPLDGRFGPEVKWAYKESYLEVFRTCPPSCRKTLKLIPTRI
jgi:hypothetical protein